MGDVYRAIDRSTGETVAIKLLRRGVGRDGSARFRRETAVLSALRHPGIVRYIDHGRWNERRAFLAMEWLEGEDLATRLRREALGLRESVAVVRAVAEALAPVHGAGVVHRDLSPANIWLCAGLAQHIKLIDFGVVKPSAEDDFETSPGAIIGTPHHMSPEQARGDDVTPRADVYALGSILFRLVTGRLVFKTPHMLALLGQLVLEDPPLASSLRPDVPEALDQLIARCISREPAERFASGVELAIALSQLGELSDEAPSEERISRVSMFDMPVVRPDAAFDPSLPAPEAPGRNERRIIATVVAQLASEVMSNDVAQVLSSTLRAGDRHERVAGGRLLLAFGVKRSAGDETLRAARAALGIAAAAPGARIAIAAGQATRKSRGISAEALERAALQLDAASPGGVRVDGTTVSLLQGRFAVREDDVGAVLLHEVLGDAGARKLLGKPTSTVGRTRELAQLTAMYNEVIEHRRPVAALVVGPSGIGKSRVRYELLKQLATRPMVPELLICRGDPMNERGGISCLGRALRAQMGVLDGEPREVQEAKVRSYVARRSQPVAPDDAEFLGEVVGVPFDDTHSEQLRAARQNPTLMQARARAALENTLRADDQHAPQVLVLEDLHWADDATIAMIDWLLGSSNMRLLVYAFARPSLLSRGAIWQSRDCRQVMLGPLGMAESLRLVDEALPEVPVDTRAALAERAGGNALFLEELIRYAAEGKEQLPLTVQALIQTRLDTLSPELRLVARAASVFGRSCWSGGVMALLGRDVTWELSELARAEVLTELTNARIKGQREYAFRHSLVRDAVYASLLDEDAQTFHAAAGRWLEEAGEDDAAALARHAHLGGETERAGSLYARATAQAYASGNVEAVQQLADEGLLCTSDGPLRAKLLVARAQAASWLGQYELVSDCARAAIDSGEPGSLDWAEAIRIVASVCRDQGRQLESATLLAQALAPDQPLHNAAARSSLLSEQARTLADLGRLAEAREVADEAMLLASAAGTQRELARLRAIDARFFVTAMAGKLGKQVEACHDVVHLADAAGDVPLATRGRCNLGHSFNQLGLFEQARLILERAARDATTIRSRPLEGFALHNLGLSLARLGTFDDAIACQRAAHAIAEEIGHNRLRTAALQYEALTLAWRRGPDDLPLALSLARSAQILAADQPSQKLTADRITAFVLLQRRSYSAALETAESCMPSAGQSQEWDELIRITLIEARLATFEFDEACAQLQDAHHVICERARALPFDEQRRGYLLALGENQRILSLARAELGLQLEVSGVG